MKKILILALLPLLSLGQTHEELVIKYAKFRTVTGRQSFNRQVTDYRAWVEIPTAMLSTPIPQARLISLFGTNELGQVNRFRAGVRQENPTLAQFVLFHTPSVNAGKTLIRIASNVGDDYRWLAITPEDLELWDTEPLPHGFGVDKWLNEAEYKALLPLTGE